MNPELVQQLISDNAAATAAYDVLSRMGGSVYLVGGAVRDIFLGKEPKDLDLLVGQLSIDDIYDALKEIGNIDYTGVESKDKEKAGRAMGVLNFRYQGDMVEIALPRVEYSTGVGHKDFDVTYDPNIPIEVDLNRRDFTANSMAIDISTGELIDPFGGQQSIASRQLSLVNPNAFQDDPLRILRAITAYSRHQLVPDENTEAAMRENADKLRNLPPSRIRMELDKILTSEDPAIAFEVMNHIGLLDYVLPEVSNTMGFDQKNKYHDMELGDHIIEVLRGIQGLTDDPDVRLAALLHDIGKPDSQWFDEEGNGHYYLGPNGEGANHEDLGSEMAKELMERLHYSNDRIERVTALVQNHMFDYFTTQTGARRFVNSLGGDYGMANDLMKLREADAGGKRGQIDPYDQEYLELNKGMLDHIQQQANAVTRAHLAINGQDIINALGIKESPQVGWILNSLLDEVLENPDLNNRDDLLAMAHNLKNSQEWLQQE